MSLSASHVSGRSGRSGRSGGLLLVAAAAALAALYHLEAAAPVAAAAPNQATDWLLKRRVMSPYENCVVDPARDGLCENCLQETSDSDAYKYCCLNDDAYRYCQTFLKRFARG